MILKSFVWQYVNQFLDFSSNGDLIQRIGQKITDGEMTAKEATAYLHSVRIPRDWPWNVFDLPTSAQIDERWKTFLENEANSRDGD